MNETLKLWFSTLLATFISGASGAVIVVVVDPIAFNFQEQWLKTLEVAAAFGLVGVANYLKKSPLPGIDGTKLGILLLCCSLSLGSMGASCSTSSGHRKAVQACYDLSVGVNATVQVTMQLNKTGVLSNQDYLIVLEALKATVQGNEEFRKLLKEAQEINSTNKFAFIALVDSISVSLGNLQTQGALRIKNQNSAAIFSAALATIRTSLVVLKGFLESVKSPSNLPQQLKSQLLPQMSREYNSLVEVN